MNEIHFQSQVALKTAESIGLNFLIVTQNILH